MMRTRLPGSAASTLSMALHELTTNALKYGALSQPGGYVALSWSLTGDRARIELDWRETGGPKVSKPKRRGFGSKMIEIIMTAEFDGKVAFDYRRDGLVLNASLRYDPPAR